MTLDGSGSPGGAYAIGCDIGVTNVKTVCVSPAGEVLGRRTAPTHAGDPGWPDGVRQHLREVEAEFGPAKWMGVASPGLASPDGSCIAWMTGRLDAVQGLNWTPHLGRAKLVPVLNDAQAALMGEVWQGAAKGCRNVMLLTLGTGVGGALMVDGNLLRGHTGRAGHLGHISLDPGGERDIVNTPGSLEGAIGNCTLESRTGGKYRTTHELYAAHAAGEADATRAWLKSVKALAAGVASLINVADPEVVILGGGIARAGEALFGPLEKYLDEFEWRPHGKRAKIVPAVLGEYAGALGAAWNALRGGA